MKIAVLKNSAGVLTFYIEDVLERENPSGDYNWLGHFVGYIDLPIEKPKKMVTKEAVATNISRFPRYDNTDLTELDTIVPSNAKNIRVTYDIEESQ